MHAECRGNERYGSAGTVADAFPWELAPFVDAGVKLTGPLMYGFKNTCKPDISRGEWLASKAALALVNGEQELIEHPECKGSSNVAAIIGCTISTSSIAVSRVVGTFGIPMISYFSTCSCLSDKQEYPTFFRTIPSDKYQSKILAELVKTFGWNWIGTVKSNTDYGNFGMRTFIEEAQKLGVCIAYTESFHRTDPDRKIKKIVQVMKEATTKVVVGFLQGGDMRVLIKEIWRQNVTGIQWIGSEGWIREDIFSHEESGRFLAGAIGLTTSRTEISGLRDYLIKIHPSSFPDNTFVKTFWETLFSCSLMKDDTTKTESSPFQVQPCTGNEHLDGLENAYLPAIMDGSSYHVYKAVYAVAHALDDMLSCEEGNGPFMNNACAHISSFEPWQVPRFHVPFAQNLAQPAQERSAGKVSQYVVLTAQSAPMVRLAIPQMLRVIRWRVKDLFLNTAEETLVNFLRQTPQSSRGDPFPVLLAGSRRTM
ncbi:hypothetical protein chiPu_0010739 [Chiloscyllium punctatum]|uniref:Receptor ligand binding region domain-containing protein n=1 Tax=Chiloscyllium punctatum TaxID=137246 RepID=A0A401SPI0_CHIPU|nr:hypothetical protein [Chiloscyllium punctatum]